MNVSSSALWRLELLGELRLVRSGDPNAEAITHFRSRKTAALLAFLALRRGAHRRETLAEVFWPETEASSARNSLRVALSSLRALLEPPGTTPGAVLEVSRECVALGRGLTSDVEAFRSELKIARSASDAPARLAALESALGWYRGPLVLGNEAESLMDAADRLEDDFLGAHVELLAGLEAQGQLRRALEIARRGAQKAPWREEIALDVLRLSLALGLPEAARDFKRWCARAQKQGIWLTDSTLARSRDLESGEGAMRIQPPQTARNSEAPRVSGLPDHWTKFVGREREISELHGALSSGTRLMTLSGPGGVGKTRLAAQIARRLAAPGAAGFGLIVGVSLADLPVASLLPGALMQALGTPPRAGQVWSPVAALREARRGAIVGGNARVLLVLDGFEHLCDDGAPLVRQWLDAMPELTCLVASRRVLAFAGETRHEVLPLETAPFQELEASSCPASALFLDRACLARPAWSPTPADRGAIARLCEHLEGLPLGLEIAAARLALLSPAQILAEIETSNRPDDPDGESTGLSVALNWKNPDRAAAPRHATLRAAMAWSERQLPVAVARFWAQTSIFHGGFTLEAASQVCECDAAPLVMALAEVSLLRFETGGDTGRALQLEIARQYAAQGLSGAEQEALGERHARYYTRWLATGPDFQLIEAERLNLKCARDWFSRHKEGSVLTIEKALRQLPEPR